MTIEDRTLRSIANASGFLFQLRVEREILQSSAGHNWQILSREHRWVDQFSNKEGFIDLVIASSAGRMVVECKRTQDASWVFLVPTGTTPVSSWDKFLWTHQQMSCRNLSSWGEFSLSPEAPISQFCVVRGQGENDSPMLERLSGVLLRSLEYLAAEEIEIAASVTRPVYRIYLPVIVTNATLHTLRIDSSQISLSSGTIDESMGTFEEVPFVKFRKNLSSSYKRPGSISGLTQANIEYDRTVLVVNSEHFAAMLPNTRIQRKDDFTDWPWDNARELEQRRP